MHKWIKWLNELIMWEQYMKIFFHRWSSNHYILHSWNEVFEFYLKTGYWCWTNNGTDKFHTVLYHTHWNLSTMTLKKRLSFHWLKKEFNKNCFLHFWTTSHFIPIIWCIEYNNYIHITLWNSFYILFHNLNKIK